MNGLGPLGISTMRPHRLPGGGVELIVRQPVLNQIMEHVGCTIDDVVDNPVAKHAVLGYYKVHRLVKRRCEIVDLERQWNPL